MVSCRIEVANLICLCIISTVLVNKVEQIYHYQFFWRKMVCIHVVTFYPILLIVHWQKWQNNFSCRWMILLKLKIFRSSNTPRLKILSHGISLKYLVLDRTRIASKFLTFIQKKIVFLFSKKLVFMLTWNINFPQKHLLLELLYLKLSYF